MAELTRDNVCCGWPAADDCRLQGGDSGVARPVLYYDTNFCLGDFYVSAILYRSAVFEGAPVQPLLMLVHERRTTKSHELVPKWLAKLSGITTPIFVVDRDCTIFHISSSNSRLLLEPHTW